MDDILDQLTNIVDQQVKKGFGDPNLAGLIPSVRQMNTALSELKKRQDTKIEVEIIAKKWFSLKTEKKKAFWSVDFIKSSSHAILNNNCIDVFFFDGSCITIADNKEFWEALK